MSYSHKLVSAVQDRELNTPEDWSVMIGNLDQFAFFGEAGPTHE